MNLGVVGLQLLMYPVDSRLDVAMADADDEDAVATTSKVVKKGKTRRFAGNGSRNDHPRAKSSIVRHNAKIAKDIAKVKSALVKEETTTVKDEPDTMPKSTEMKSFKIGDTAKVVQFFETTFDFLQQQVDKKVAKAWIKTTCPKKQAKFPYSDKNRWEEFGLGPEIPKWWPEGCDFREPDHLSKPRKCASCSELVHCILLANTSKIVSCSVCISSDSDRTRSSCRNGTRTRPNKTTSTRA